MAGKPTMIDQYRKIKQSYQDALLFFRLGDFYELFMEDAVVVSERLGLTLTGRGSGESRMPMCGVPYHAADTYITRLLKEGFRIAICEQLEDPKTTKGLVRRDVVRIITPGTGFDYRQDRHLLIGCLDFVDETNAVAAVIDPMSGDSYRQSGTLSDVQNWLFSFTLAEIIVSTTQTQAVYAYGKQLAAVRQIPFATFHEIIQSEMGNSPETIIKRYLLYTGKRELTHLKEGQEQPSDVYLHLSETARRNLELVATMNGDRKGSTLFDVIDFTQTSLGKRQLKAMIERPFAQIAWIEHRQAAVRTLVMHRLFAEEIQQHLKGFPDLTRLLSRVSYGTASPRDILLIAKALQTANTIWTLFNDVPLEGELKDLASCPIEVQALITRIMQTLIDDPQTGGKDGEIIRAGVSEEIDRLRSIASGGRTYLAQLETTLRQQTGIKSLKIAYNKVFGYYIEVTSANTHLVPTTYERKQTLVGAERFTTKELRDYERDITQADEQLKILEAELFSQVVAEVQRELVALQKIAEAIALLDALNSLATCAVEYGYTCPEITTSTELSIEEGRHPVVERFVTGQYVPNDTLFLETTRRIGLVTGPNMAGKSTYMRQVALIVILAQMGAFVPAKRAKIGLVDKLYTRVGASDDVAMGLSTFMVEMTEAAEMLRGQTARSLLLFDEIGRGTATYDGMSIAEAMIEYLHDTTKARTLFATHYHELTSLPERLDHVFNLSVAVSEKEDQIVFLHRIVERPADRSYGIQVARFAGLPEPLIERAKVILHHLEHAPSPFAPQYEQVKTLFDEPSDDNREAMQVLQQLLELDLDACSPKEALRLLYAWQNKLQAK